MKTIKKGDKDNELGIAEETKTPGTTTNPIMALETAVPEAEEEKKKDADMMAESGRSCLFRYSDPILNKWDTFIIIIAIYNSFTLSFNIGFDPDFASNPIYITFDVILIF